MPCGFREFVYRGHTLVPPLAVLDTRMGHFAGSSPMLPIVMKVLLVNEGVWTGKEAVCEGRDGEFL